MKFHNTPIDGVRLIELEKRGDDRGFFARMFCEREFRNAGLETGFVQINNSFSSNAGTLRGLHFQLPPAPEVKVMRCVRGALFDVVVDMRPDSGTFGKWFGAELSAENRMTMYVPRGFAHGFISLTNETEVIYLVSAFYAAELERGLRWNDLAVGISWPIEPLEISDKDRAWPDIDLMSPELGALRGLK